MNFFLLLTTTLMGCGIYEKTCTKNLEVVSEEIGFDIEALLPEADEVCLWASETDPCSHEYEIYDEDGNVLFSGTNVLKDCEATDDTGTVDDTGSVDTGSTDDTGTVDDTGSVDTGSTDDTGTVDDTGLVDTGSTDDEGVDADGDGFTADVDCDDSDAEVNPEASEVCDAIDNDCDDSVDEGLEADCLCIEEATVAEYDVAVLIGGDSSTWVTEIDGTAAVSDPVMDETSSCVELEVGTASFKLNGWGDGTDLWGNYLVGACDGGPYAYDDGDTCAAVSATLNGVAMVACSGSYDLCKGE